MQRSYLHQRYKVLGTGKGATVDATRFPALDLVQVILIVHFHGDGGGKEAGYLSFALS